MHQLVVVRGPRPEVPIAKVLGGPQPTRRPKYFDSFERVEVQDPLDLFMLASSLNADPLACVCLGDLGQPNENGKWRRCLKPLPKNRKQPEQGEDPAGLTSGRGASVLVIDHDSGVYPPGTDADTPLQELAEQLVAFYVARAGLQESVAGVVQYSASHNTAKGCRAKLMFCCKLTAWPVLNAYFSGRLQCDAAMASPAQIVYTAGPVVAPEGLDPLAGRARTYLVEGHTDVWPDIDPADTDVEAWKRLHDAVKKIAKIEEGEARHPIINREAWEVGRYVAAGRLPEDVAVEWLAGACDSADTIGPNRTDVDEIRRAVQDGDKSPKPDRATMEGLDVTRQGEIKPTLANVVTLLDNSADIVENDFGDVELRTTPPWALDGETYPALYDDAHVLRSTVWLQREHHTAFQTRDVNDAAKTIGAENQVNRLLEYLDRVATLPPGPLTVDNIGAAGWKADDNLAHRLGASKFFLQCVRRAYEPGCKADLVLVIQGRPGTGKSRSMRALFTRPGDRYFTDSTIPIGNAREYAPVVRGLWGAELKEQNAVSKWHQDSFKSFLDQQIVRYRAPYERRASDVKLRVGYGWTTEKETPLNDPNTRRIIFIRAKGWCDPEPAELDAFWGSVVRAYREGRTTWVSAAEGEVLADSRKSALNVDPLTSAVEEFLHDGAVAEHTQPHIYALNRLASNQKYGVKVGNHKDKVRVAEIMKTLGWSRDIKWDGSTQKTVRSWVPPAGWAYEGDSYEADVLSIYDGIGKGGQ